MPFAGLELEFPSSTSHLSARKAALVSQSLSLTQAGTAPMDGPGGVSVESRLWSDHWDLDKAIHILLA